MSHEMEPVKVYRVDAGTYTERLDNGMKAIVEDNSSRYGMLDDKDKFDFYVFLYAQKNGMSFEEARNDRIGAHLFT